MADTTERDRVLQKFAKARRWLDMESVAGQITRSLDDAADYFRESLVWDINREVSRDIESPIEAIFLAHYVVAIKMGIIATDVDLIPQAPITLHGQEYRADFLAVPHPRGWYRDLSGVFNGVVIELDGHDFHERTKAQVTYRNLRDRALQEHGWPVLHYSGTELYQRGMDTVLDAMRAVGTILSEKAAQRTTETTTV